MLILLTLHDSPKKTVPFSIGQSSYFHGAGFALGVVCLVTSQGLPVGNPDLSRPDIFLAVII